MKVLLSRPALLGQAPAHAGGTPRRLVGREQDWFVAAIETSRGWLVFYHGVRHTPSGCLYRLDLALFDLENPAKCLLRGDSWIFGPEAGYERHSDVDDVLFPCGYTMDPDGDRLNIYYEAADCSIALARSSVRSLLDWLDANGSSERRRAQDL